MTSNRRIETKSSTTASIMCLVRAASYKDKRECYSGPDYVAYELVPGFFKFVIRSRWLFKVLSRRWFSKGIYEYVIARTKYFDEAFSAALSQGFDQIVILGAGFDSRAIRFGDLNSGTIVFELDAPITQQEKLKAYESKKFTIPKGLVFVPIDFNKERLEDKLNRAGFVAGKKTLFMLEGVTMYLSKDAVEGALRFISESSGKGSLIVFDHIYGGVLRGENKYYGEKGMYKRTAKAGEEWTFALEENEAEPFLAKFGFTVKDCCSAHELEERYFRNSKGVIVTKINGIHAVATAIKS
jgi:methyltransferase (TIGR00027 family)